MTLSTGIVLDTNLLVLFSVGSWKKSYISKFKRTAKYEPSDFDLLLSFLAAHKPIVVTPNIVTETVNLLGQLEGRYKAEVFNVLRTIIGDTQEKYVTSESAMTNDLYLRFGVTDSSIETLARQGLAVLSDDFPLVGWLWKENLTAVNFAHIRSQALLS